MTTAIIGGPVAWEGSQDSEGHRELKVDLRIRGAVTDGPFNVLNTPGMPAVGSTWSYGGDVDPWCWRKPETTMKQYAAKEGEPNRFWTVTLTYSTKPQKRCSDTNIENPLLEPQKLSGGFSKDKVEASRDRFGRAITNSAWEQIRGPLVEFEEARPIIKIEQNVAVLNWPLVASMVNTVNYLPLWGFPRRTVKLADADWERKFWGTCFRYYVRKFSFEVNAIINPATGLVSSGWDRDLLDEGTKVLGGAGAKWSGSSWDPGLINGAAPDRFNPMHFTHFIDRKGNPIKGILNGAGKPAGSIVGTEGQYVSIVDGNLGQSVTDSTKWIPVAGDLTDDPFLEWQSTARYVRGNFAQYTTGAGSTLYYVALRDNRDANPVASSSDWRNLPYGPPGLIGQYDAATTYLKGDVVTEVVGSELGAGNIHVEKLNESVFSLLGIPLNLEE